MSRKSISLFLSLFLSLSYNSKEKILWTEKVEEEKEEKRLA
jgi:hypothetical protein